MCILSIYIISSFSNYIYFFYLKTPLTNYVKWTCFDISKIRCLKKNKKIYSLKQYRPSNNCDSSSIICYVLRKGQAMLTYLYCIFYIAFMNTSMYNKNMKLNAVFHYIILFRIKCIKSKITCFKILYYCFLTLTFWTATATYMNL